MKVIINIENLETSTLEPNQIDLINLHKNKTLEIKYYDPSLDYPFIIKLGDINLEFKSEELEFIYNV